MTTMCLIFEMSDALAEAACVDGGGACVPPELPDEPEVHAVAANVTTTITTSRHVHRDMSRR